MKKSIKYYIIMIFMMFCLFTFGGEKANAAIDNFVIDNNMVVIENNSEYPFVDVVKNEENVIKSGNANIQESVSTLIIKFTGIGEISFNYLISSESNFDVLTISVNEGEMVFTSGNGNWERFSFYSEENVENVISISYTKDGTDDLNDDCVYLKDLVVDETLYSSIIDFYIDDNSFNSSGVYYYGENNDSILTFEDVENYVFEVSLNGYVVDMVNNSFDLKNNEHWKTNNEVDINYKQGDNKTRYISIRYNASLTRVLGNYSYTNERDNLFILDTDGNGNYFVKTSGESKGSYRLAVIINGAGTYSFSYKTSSRENYDFYRVMIDGNYVIEKSGLMEEFEEFSYTFYDDTEHYVNMEYYKSSNDIVGGDCVYLKDFSFETINYVDLPSIMLNDAEVYNGDKISIDSNVDYKITFENMDTLVEAVVSINGAPVLYSEEYSAYLLDNLDNVNIVSIVFSRDEYVDRVITFYLYVSEVDNVFVFENDDTYPFVRDLINGEEVIRSNVGSTSEIVNELSYTANERGTLAIEYMASFARGDYFLVLVNGEIKLKINNVFQWETFSCDLYADDQVVLRVIKDGIVGDDEVYIKNVTFEAKNYTIIANGVIGGHEFSKGIDVIYFDYNDNNKNLYFTNLRETQTVKVFVNGQEILNPADGVYDFSEYILLNNVIRIIYSEVGYSDDALEFNYNAKLIGDSNISYTNSQLFVLDVYEETVVVTLDKNVNYYDDQLTLSFSGIGYFKMAFKYNAGQDISVVLSGLTGVDIWVVGGYDSGEWQFLEYKFENDEEHIVTIKVNGSFNDMDNEYIYFKDFVFVRDSDLLSLIEGDGSDGNAYDYTNLILKIKEAGLNLFEHNYYNEVSVTSIYINVTSGYSFMMNDVAIENSGLVTISSSGINTLVIGDESNFIRVRFINQGVRGTSITEGFGTVDSPFNIYTVDQLKEIDFGLEYVYKLKNDIELSGEWTPIGDEENPFRGIFDGDNKTISNINIDNFNNYSGLFGVVINGIIKNINLEDINITKGLVVGSLIGKSINTDVSEVTISNINIDISCEDNSCYVGGIVGIAQSNSEFSDVSVSGLVSSISSYTNFIGGLSGEGGNFSSIESFVDVRGNGYVGGIIGSSSISVLADVTIFGDVSVVGDCLLGNGVGIISSDIKNVTIINVIHKLSGTYSYLDSDNNPIASANVYGVGLREEGIPLTLSEGSFSIDLNLVNDLDNNLNGILAGVNGYVVRFSMNNGNYRYFEIFDFDNMSIKSSEIVIDVGMLNEYENNFSTLVVNNENDKYQEIVDGEKTISMFLNVLVDNVDDVEHLSYVINYGIATNFGSYYVDGEHISTLNFIINSNLDFSASNFKGLSNSAMNPYKGSIDGQNKTIKLGINKPNSFVSAFINYYSGDEIKDIVLEGSVSSKYYGGFVGIYSSTTDLKFSNITNYMVVTGVKGASLLGYRKSGSVIIEGCINYANFDSTVFVAYSTGIIKYSGVNKNYGKPINNDLLKNINEIFFAYDSASGVGEEATLENYYDLNVLKKDITVNINGVNYTSDPNGIIKFVMNNNNLYSATISNDYINIEDYELESSFSGELVIPFDISLDSSNVYLKEYDGEWVLKATVTFSDDSDLEIELGNSLSEVELNGDELVFENVVLSHELYIIPDSVTLKRVSGVLDKYKNNFALFTEMEEEFKERAISLQNELSSLNEFYVIDNVSEASIEFYNEYIVSNNISEEALNLWLKVIVDTVELKDDNVSIVYGENLTASVIVTYLYGNTSEVELNFAYSIDDINGELVSITSLENIVSKYGEKVVYNSPVSFVVNLARREVTVSVEKYEFEYDGSAKSLKIDFIISNKFGDEISNVVVRYFNSKGEETIPVDVGVYSVDVTYDLTNRDLYDLSGVVFENLVIKEKELEVMWEYTFDSEYSSTNKMDEIKAYYVDVNLVKNYLDFDIEYIVDVGEYVVNVIFDGDNYVLKESTRSKTFVVTKANLSLTISDYEIKYGNNIPNIEVSVEGLKENDDADVDYIISKNDVEYLHTDILECGEYSLIVDLANIDDLEKNYNITITNGVLLVLGIDTRVIANSSIEYSYNGVNFNITSVNPYVVDEWDERVEGATFSVLITKDDEEVNEAIDVGEYVVKIIFESTGGYNGSFVFVNLTIIEEEVILTIDNKSSQYGDEEENLTFTVTEGNIFDLSALNVVLSKEEGSLVGEYAITGSYSNDNYIITFIDGVYEIIKREIVITINNKQSDYLQPLAALTYSVGENDVIGNDNLNVILTKGNGTIAGEYEITGTYDNNQYNATIITGVYTINKIDIENVIFGGFTTTYNGMAVEYGVNNTILSDGSEAVVSYFVNDIENAEIINAGEYEIVVLVNGGNNYNELRIEDKIIVERASNTLGYEEERKEVEYSGVAFDYYLDNITFIDGNTAEVTYTLIKNNEIVDSIIDAGIYVVISNIKDTNNNYYEKDSTMTVMVYEQRIIVEYGEVNSFIYTGSSQSPTVSSSVEIDITYDTIDGSEPINVGEYTVMVSSVSPNYIISNSTYDFEITEYELQYINNHNREYDYCATDFNNTMEVSGVLGNDEVYLKFEYYKNEVKVEEIIDVGEYVVKAVGLDGRDSLNYKLSSVGKEFVVEIYAKEIEILPIGVNKVYGDDDPVIDYETSYPLYQRDSFEGALSREVGENVGIYEITLGTLSLKNYIISLSEVPVYLTITQKVVTIEYEMETFYYDGSDKKLQVIVDEGAHVEYIGDTINVGTYYVRVVVDDENYKLADDYNDIEVIIHKRDVSNVIVLESDSYVYSGNSIELDVDCGDYDCNIVYYKGTEVIYDIINVGNYRVSISVENENEYGYFESDIFVNKAENDLGYDVESITIEYSSIIDYRLNSTTFSDGREAIVSYVILKDNQIVEEIVELGEYIVVANIKDELKNYKDKVSTFAITVVKKQLTIEYGNTTLVYSGIGQHPSIGCAQPLNITFDTIDGEEPVVVGEYLMSVSTVSDNYVVVNNTIEFEIIPLEIRYSNFDDVVKEYDAIRYTSNVVINNIKDNDDVSLVIEYFDKRGKVDYILNAGEYRAVISGLSGNDSTNYVLNNESDEISIIVNPKEIIVSPYYVSKSYGSYDPVIKYLLSEDLYEGDEVEGMLVRERGENVGKYEIYMGTLFVSNNYILKMAQDSECFEILPLVVTITYEMETFYYNGSEQKLTVSVSEGAHVEYVGDLVNAGSYTIKVVIDDSNYRLGDDYEDIEVKINKRNISNIIEIDDSSLAYTGESLTPDVNCGSYTCDVVYYNSSEEILEEIILPGIYFVEATVETQNEFGVMKKEILVNKKDGIAKEVTIEAYSNKFVLDGDDTLEYSIDGVMYYSSPILDGLSEKTDYMIRVRSKETNISYASNPIVYSVTTTSDPKLIHDSIDLLVEEVNEDNIRILKEIKNNLPKVNMKELDEEKYAYYQQMWEKYENIIDSYKDNIETANKVSSFVEFGIMMSSIIIPMLAVLFVIKKRFN